MTEHNHSHDHDPLKDMEHLAPVEGPQRPMEPAMKHLSDALSVSFRLLSVLMVVFVALFLATGISSISAQEQGLIKVFGRITGVAKEGLAYNWPFPIGEIEKVSTQEQRLLIEAFWMYETPEDKLKDLSQRNRTNSGLRPGWDGYLLTGDRNLVHIKFQCAYRVQDPIAVRTRFAELEPVLRDVLCRAAIAAGAVQTADAIQADPTEFLENVQSAAQAELDILLDVQPGQPRAVGITSVVLPSPDAKSWPLAALTSYENAQRAKSEKQTKINKAVSEARDLTKVVGEGDFTQLAGQPWLGPQEEAKLTEEGVLDGKSYNLIGQLTRAQDELDAAPSGPKAEALRARVEDIQTKIDELLTSATAGGEVRRIIEEADTDKTRIIQQAQRRAEEFVRLHAQYVRSPQLFLEKTWAATVDEILRAPTNTKYYVHPGQKGDVVYISRDPKIFKEIRDYLRKKKQEESK